MSKDTHYLILKNSHVTTLYIYVILQFVTCCNTGYVYFLLYTVQLLSLSVVTRVTHLRSLFASCHSKWYEIWPTYIKLTHLLFIHVFCRQQITILKQTAL